MSETKKRHIDEPVMSDLTIILSVEDLINIAMGPPGKNVVNFKMIQTVLHILARQMRLLTTRVELRISENQEARRTTSDDAEGTSPSTRSSPGYESDKRDGKVEKFSKMTGTEDDEEQEKLKHMSPKERKKYMKAKEQELLKEQKALEKMSPIEKEAYLKEKEAAEKISRKEKEKQLKKTGKEEEKDVEKMSPKEREKYLKEKEALDKMSPKEREKYLKEKEAMDKMSPKEKEEFEKMTPKEKEKYLKEKEEKLAKEKSKTSKQKEDARQLSPQEKERRDLENMSPREREKYQKDKLAGKKGHAASGTSIAISEVEHPKGDKVLIVEKGPRKSTAVPKTRVGSIEVVTHSQFDMLEAIVKDLAKKAGPLPMPTLPDNETLMSALVQGSASLTDTMQAMQVSARVQAAEQAIERMVGLLTQLAASGAFPEELTGHLESVWADLEAMHGSSAAPRPRLPTGVTRKSVGIDPLTSHATSRSEGLRGPRSSNIAGHPSVVAAGSAVSSAGVFIGVTYDEMNDALQALKEEMLKNVNSMTHKASSAAETAAVNTKSVVEKLDIALNLDSRISTLYGLTNDYAEQLSGFDEGITTQMRSFQEQMGQMRGELTSGLQQLTMANNNAETAAVLELSERYEVLESELDRTVTDHQNLTTSQKQLGDELRSLVEAVEMLREQKADTDEVLDGLRDKADLSRLAGLLSEQEFAIARVELESRLAMCYDKFQKQENVWMGALKDLTNVAEDKAELMQLLGLREETQQALSDIQEKLRILDIQLGEPKAAMLTRIISKDGTCGACKEPALMEPTERTQEAPPPLPALRPRRAHGPAPPPEHCAPDAPPPPPQLAPEDDKTHMCQRWVGGSHTLLGAVTREKAVGVIPTGAPVKKYAGYGPDGKMYMMEEELLPCAECNKLTSDKPEEPEMKADKEVIPKQDEGAGDTVKITTVMPRCICTTPH